MRSSEVISGSEAPAIALRHISKSFGGSRALSDVDLTVLCGEVHGLLGENGSGKSTLIKILAGYHASDSGELEMYGKPVDLPLQPGQFRALGLDFVHQDLGLIPSLSVIENLRVGELARPRHRWHVSWSRERRLARETFDRYGVRLDPLARVADLPLADRALLAIVRAVEGIQATLADGDNRGSRGVLILDEPTVFLSKAERGRLFALLRELVAMRASVLLISHDLDQVREITDRVTVLRDGRVVGTVVTSETSAAQIVEMIIGRRLAELVADHDNLARQNVYVLIEGLTAGILSNVSIELHQGEIVGVTGLVGSGFEEIPGLLFGVSRAEAGRLTIDGSVRELRALTPVGALDAGLVLVPADRHRDGSVGSLPIVDNIAMPVMNNYFRALILRHRRMSRDVRVLMSRFDVRPNDPRLGYSLLSGGNQQKALLAKWLQMKPSLLLLHEPTQGVDVGARQQIFALIQEAARSGTSVLCASSDYEQLAIICDRVLVLRRGRVVAQLVGKDITKEGIAEQCYRGDSSDSYQIGFPHAGLAD
jgi:ribose transport system ATP-binding protein